MEISIDPRPGHFQESLASIPSGQPVVMLNLLQFNERANYSKTHDNESLSGKEAYSLYARQALDFIAKLGGQVIFNGCAKASLIAPSGEHWDQVFLVRYPDIGRFVAMVTNPDYQAITHHRSAALANSRLIAMTEQAMQS